MANGMETKRIINLPAESAPADGDMFVVDNEATGTKKLPITGLIEPTPTQGSAKAVSSGGVWDVENAHASAIIANMADITELDTLGVFNGGIYEKLAQSSAYSNITWTEQGDISGIDCVLIDQYQTNNRQCRLILKLTNGKYMMVFVRISTVNSTVDINTYYVNLYTHTTSGTNAAVGQPNPVAVSADLTGKVVVSARFIGNIIRFYVNGEFVSTRTFEDKSIVIRAGWIWRGTANNKNEGFKKIIPVFNRQKKFIHFSFDDQIGCLKDITDNADTYTSIFDSQYFAPMQAMHDSYGCKFTFNLFWSQNTEAGTSDASFTLAKVTDKFKTEFENCSDWIKFAYHSKYVNEYATNISVETLLSQVNETYTQITRFAGVSSIDRCPRLGYYATTQDQCIALRQNFLMTGFLTADDTRVNNMGLSGLALTAVQDTSKFLDIANDITYFKTHIRAEEMNADEAVGLAVGFNDSPAYTGNLIVFGHNYITKTEILTNMQAIAEWGSKNGFVFDYPQNYC